MIRVILTGGLGNQMFEYAAGKVLALKLGKKLTLDLYALNKKTKGVQRNFELNIFNIDPNISSSWETQFLVKSFPIVDKSRRFFGYTFNYYRDKSAIVYLPEFEKLNGNVILHGHFQNEKYFIGYKDIIRKEFSFKAPLTGRNNALAARIQSTESIAVHIRRSDYLTDSNFALCSADYYSEAISQIKEKIENPHFFIFSQDFEWVKENISLGDSPVEYVDWNKKGDSYIDMQLMSLCKHNIIANSSFSWWAAWLNANPEKMIYAPSKWFREEVRNSDLKYFYPSGWTIVNE